ncbi:MAG: hypothetical protein KF836_11610 [Fimbriimonadaceae bacterium]|nr:hypothetical protein [Fimbriimonadaceae bacterium]
MKITVAVSILLCGLVFGVCSVTTMQAANDRTELCMSALAEYAKYDVNPRTSTENLKKIIKTVKSSQTNCTKGDILLWMTEINFIDPNGQERFLGGTTSDLLIYFCGLFYDVPSEDQGWVKVFEEKENIVLTGSPVRMGPMPDSRDMFVLNSKKYPLRKFPNKYL